MEILLVFYFIHGVSNIIIMNTILVVDVNKLRLNEHELKISFASVHQKSLIFVKKTYQNVRQHNLISSNNREKLKAIAFIISYLH